MILTVDSGTSVTKVAIWERDGLAAVSGIPLETQYPAPGWVEQDPSTWWASVVSACGELRRRAPGAFGSVEAVSCTGARQTFALVGAHGRPAGPGIVWSDRRAGREAGEVAARTGVEPGLPSAAGIVLDGASVAAKVAWLAGHQKDGFEAAAWIMTPRDLVVWNLTGVVATDPTMASRSGLYDGEGTVLEGLAGPAATKLPPVTPSGAVTGLLVAEAAATTGLPPGIPVVIGAGDRACEVLGAGASETRPMVSWGTTANVSVPVAVRPEPPPGVVASRAADGGWLLEGGLSGAGSLIEWLSRLTGRTPEDLAVEARTSPPGARGVVAAPWLDGARSPWWRPDAAAALVGLGPTHGPADVARALYESVAWEVARGLGAMARRSPDGPPVVELALAGSGAATPVWLEALTGVTGLPASHRRSGQAASAGAARLAAGALGLDWELDLLDPVESRIETDPERVRRYRRLGPRADSVAASVVDLDPAPAEEPPCG
ncbi:MAG: xylulokinase [Acidimicrobiales bacterium]